ncbi:MAG: T9SS type A sorting domain-containing protein [Flavobacteriales bacterium]|nr:T9SS type A sorting domain-containing protein [Flavobacteriales bacterium]
MAIELPYRNGEIRSRPWGNEPDTRVHPLDGNTNKTKVMMRIFSTIIAVLICAHGVPGQNILNSSFENNIESECVYNLNNTAFNSSMQDVHAFGTVGQMDIQNNGCDVIPQLGNWCVGLATFSWGGHDAITLETTSPLSVGVLYELTFWTYNNTTYSSILGPPQDSIEIGLSPSAGTYGQKIYTSFPQLDTWQLHTVQFVADSSYSFISVYMKEDFSSSTWIQVDNFSISPIISTTTNEHDFVNKIALYPNPTFGDFSIDLGTTCKEITITIIDSNGKVIQSHNHYGNQLLNLNLEEPEGLYFLIIESGDNNTTIQLVIRK